MKTIYSAIILLFLTTFSPYQRLYGQNTGGQVVTVQPSIIVIPYVKEGQDIRTILESDVNKRIAVTLIKDGFDQRGFTTYDFVQTLKNVQTNQAMTIQSQTDIQSTIIAESGADIYVAVEVSTTNSSSGNSVDLILTAYESSTARSLANKVCSSGKYYTTDGKLLVQKALSSTVIPEFLNVIQMKFNDIVQNGRSVTVEFSLSSNATLNLSKEIDGLPLSDFLEVWMSENAYKNNYRTSGATSTRMIFDDVRIPVRDQNGNNYTPSKFALKLYLDLKKAGLSVTKDVKRQNIYITFQ